MLDDMTLIRGTALQGFVGLVTELGGDPRGLLSAARIPYRAVGDPERWIGYPNVAAAVTAAAVATGTPDFGRRLAERQGIEILGPVGAAARTARTVADGLISASQYLSVFSRAIETELVTTADPHLRRLEYRIVTPGIPDPRQANELALGVILKIVRLLAGEQFRPTAVHVPHEPMTARTDYVRYFGARTRFAMPVAAIELKDTDLLRPVDADSDLHGVVRSYLSAVAPPEHHDLSDQVLLLVRNLLPTGGLTMPLVAQQLAMHPRTLQRRLAERGTTFEALLDQGRREIARNLLRDSQMPMSQVAGVLGYSEQSVLTRACQRWFGATPSAYRNLPA
ncbi:MAG: AraC family transcriptional regulator [Marmoricola sp.]|nr:AraC family transcriptional regulator [Marmoricola sp.]